MDHKNAEQFVNEYGFEEWWTEDRKGHRVDCYANRLIELHVKRPFCDCERLLRKIAPEQWECTTCKRIYTVDDLFRQYETWEDYNCEKVSLQDDYGERDYPDRRLICGPRELYDFYRRHPLK